MYTPTFPHQHAANPESHTHILAVNPNGATGVLADAAGVLAGAAGTQVPPCSNVANIALFLHASRGFSPQTRLLYARGAAMLRIPRFCCTTGRVGARRSGRMAGVGAPKGHSTKSGPHQNLARPTY